jgi:ABC-2 type transport system permease protein
MKLLEVFRFELGYQARRLSTWIYFAVLLGFTWQVATEGYFGKARGGGYFFNAPILVAELTFLGGTLALLAAAAFAGDAAGRDAQTRMHPLTYTAPVRKGVYLGGRFAAAFTLAAGILLAVPIGLLLATYVPGPEAELVGPFRPAAYLGAYLFFALPNALVATALGFALAALTRRLAVSYVAGVLLVLASVLSWLVVAGKLGRWDLARLLDPLGLTVAAGLSRTWTALEKNVRLVELEGPLLWNRVLWLGVALGVLALTHARFRLAHPAAGGGRRRGAERGDPLAPAAGRIAPVAAPRVRGTFGPATRARQAAAFAGEALREIVTGWGGLGFAVLAALLVLTAPAFTSHMGVPLFPTTGHITRFVGYRGELVWAIIPLLTVFYAGELVWRERDAGLAEIADAAPVPDWVPLAGRVAGLGLALAALQALLAAASMLVQALQGFRDFEPGLYARVLLGLQLADHLLFALLAVAVHVLVSHKYVGHMLLALVYGFMVFAPELGIGHNLLVYGSDPGWAYSDMRGFRPFLGPWLWFKLYWAAWALLLAVAARLLWVRGREPGFRARLALARRRFTPRAAGAAVVAAGLVLLLGGFVFYNTSVLHEHRTAADALERSAEYERRYGRYRGAAQPQLAGTRLHVEIHPGRRAVEARGTYLLVNRSGAVIDTVHLSMAPLGEVRAIRFDRPAEAAVVDDAHRHRSYALGTPLRPGDSLRLAFAVRLAPRGFPDRGADASVVANGTYLQGHDLLPSIGYEPGREIAGAGDRRVHGLPPRPAIPSLHDPAARRHRDEAGRIAFEATVGTDAGEVAVAPGALRRTWTEGGRRYFHYAADVPIRNDVAFFSAAYAVHRSRWNDVAVEVFHHPGHAWNADRMARGVRAALDYHTREFGPYPHRQLRLVEHPGSGMGLHAYPVNVSYSEGFALLRPEADPRDIDFPFAVVAHEVAHQWWGNQLTPADAEGAALLSESLAWYSALNTVEAAYGPEHLRRLLGMMREAYLSPHARGGVPLLRATDWLHARRKGPFAMYALREYVGEARVNAALRRLLAEHGRGEPPLPTSLDLYRELRAATPDSLRPLLRDLFEANTFWALAAEGAAAEPAGGGAWRVTLDVRARKLVVDTVGLETEVPMDDVVEVGVYAAGDDGGRGEPLYLRMHRVRSGRQRITVTVPGRPARAGIDPRGLLIDDEPGDNVAEVR